MYRKDGKKEEHFRDVCAFFFQRFGTNDSSSSRCNNLFLLISIGFLVGWVLCVTELISLLPFHCCA